MSSPAPEISEKRPLAGWRWWTRETIALVIWCGVILLGCQSTGIISGLPVMPSLRFGEVATVVFGVIALCWITGTKTIGLAAYIATFPLVLCVRTVTFIFKKHWPILLTILPSLQATFRSLRLRAGVLAVGIAAGFASFSSRGFEVRLAACFVILAYIVWHYIWRFITIYHPSTFYSEIVVFLENCADVISTHKQKVQVATPTQLAHPDDAKEKDRAAKLLLMYVASATLEKTTKRLERIQKSGQLDLGLIFPFLWTLVFTLVAFSIIFLSISQVAPDSFTPPGPMSLLSAILFSISNFLSNDVSGVTPASSIAKVFSNTEGLLLWAWVLLGAFSLLTSLREKRSKDLEALIERFRKDAQKLGHAFETDFSLTQTSVEHIILSFAGPVAKWCISWRRGQEYAEQLAAEAVPPIAQGEKKVAFKSIVEANVIETEQTKSVNKCKTKPRKSNRK